MQPHEDPALESAMRAALAELRRADDLHYAEVRYVDDAIERLRVRDGRPEQVGRASTRGVGIRVLAKGAWGFACSADTSEGALVTAAKRTLDIARSSARASKKPVVLPEQSAQTGAYTTPLTIDPETVPLGEK